MMRIAPALVKALLGVLLALEAAATPRVFLVTAGNNTGNAGELPLRYAEDDATSFARVLRRLGQAKSADTASVLGEKARDLRRSIVEMNARIRGTAQGGISDSVLIVYYSGHADPLGLHMDDSTLPFDELRGLVKGSAAKVRLLIIDSCRSGTLTRVKGLKRANRAFDISIQGRATLGVEGMAIITSSAAGEDSHEDDRLHGSFFSHHLIAALRGAGDRNRDGAVTLAEAYSYSYQQTLRSSGSGTTLQHPTFQFDIKGRGALVLTRLKADRGRSCRLLMRRSGLYLVLDTNADGRIVAEVSAGKRGTLLVLPPGRYLVQRRQPRVYYEYKVNLEAGQTVDLARIKNERFDYARLLRKGGGTPSAIHGLQLLGGARGEVVAGAGPTPQVVFGYGVDLAPITLGVRLRWATAAGETAGALTSYRQHELAAGLVVERYVDLRYFSLVFGASIEGILHLQSFDSDGEAPDRTAWGVGITVLLGFERALGGGLSIRIETGPRTEVYERVRVVGGAADGTELATPLTWWVAGGLTWRL